MTTLERLRAACRWVEMNALPIREWGLLWEARNMIAQPHIPGGQWTETSAEAAAQWLVPWIEMIEKHPRTGSHPIKAS